MGSFLDFIAEISGRLKSPMPDSWSGMTEVELAQRLLQGLNECLYQTYEGIGTTTFSGEELQYFSEFHKFWEQNHREILNARIGRGQARLATEGINHAVQVYGRAVLGVTHETSVHLHQGT